LKRVMVFIDGNNFEKAVNTLYGAEIRLDYIKLAQHIAQTKCSGDLRRLYYYTAKNENPQNEQERNLANNTALFADRLNKLPNCIAKLGRLSLEGIEASGKKIYVEKKTDVNIAVDMVSLAYTNAYDEAVLLSADTDYEAAVNVVRQIGRNVTVGLVSGQTGGYLKTICDDNFVLDKTDLNRVKRL